MRTLLKYYPVPIIISAFGPYIFPGLGLKLDNLIIYPLALLVLFFVIANKKITINKSILGIFLVWFSIFAYSLIRTTLGGGYTSFYSFMADIKNLSQPLALILLFMLVTKEGTKNALRLLKVSIYTLIGMLVANSLWIIIGFNIDTQFMNQYFWGGGDSVALRAADNGRFGGVFNQPIESGIAYAVGVLGWLYLAEKKLIKINIISVIVLALLFMGGAFSVSKAFVILGVALFFVGVFTNKVMLWRIMPLTLLFSVIGYFIYYYLTKTWDGLNYLLRLFDGSNYQSQGFINMVTAGRYGTEDSQQSGYFSRIWESSPVIGEGLGSQHTYDSAHFFFFSTGGLVSLLAYIMLIAVFVWLIYDMFVTIGYNSELRFFIGLVALIALGGLGAPTLTINRASVVLWVMALILLQYLCQVKTQRYKNKIELEEKSIVVS